MRCSPPKLRLLNFSPSRSELVTYFVFFFVDQRVFLVSSVAVKFTAGEIANYSGAGLIHAL
jgi:hypothetical protein